jgi:hypothetical protein
MLWAPVYLLFVGAGWLAVTERSASLPGTIGIVALGAVGLGTCALLVLERGRPLSRSIAFILALGIGGATTYTMSVPEEDFGWLVAVFVWIFGFVVLLDVALLGDAIWKPVMATVDWLGRGEGNEPPSKERAAVRAVTPSLLASSILGGGTRCREYLESAQRGLWQPRRFCRPPCDSVLLRFVTPADACHAGGLLRRAPRGGDDERISLCGTQTRIGHEGGFLEAEEAGFRRRPGPQDHDRGNGGLRECGHQCRQQGCAGPSGETESGDR